VVNQEGRSRRSQALILDAALDLFSHQGYRATSIRDIAQRAGVSTGNVYHHFKDKDTIFRALLDQYWSAIEDTQGFSFNRALASGPFPDNLEVIGLAARDMVVQYRRHIALIYVDVVEFDGQHIRKFYADMAERFERFAAAHPSREASEGRLRPGVSLGTALMLATRFFMNYFAVEVLFGVTNHFGRDSDRMVETIADILRHGLAAPGTAGAPVAVITPEGAPPAAVGPVV
jgi:AcrR family transcriptional regulator